MKMNILKEEEELDDELGFMELQHSSDGLRWRERQSGWVGGPSCLGLTADVNYEQSLTPIKGQLWVCQVQNRKGSEKQIWEISSKAIFVAFGNIFLLVLIFIQST